MQKTSLCLVKLAKFLKHDPQIIVRLNVTWFKCKRFSNLIGRFVQLAKFMECDS